MNTEDILYMALFITTLCSIIMHFRVHLKKRELRDLHNKYQRLLFQSEDLTQDAKILETINDVASEFNKEPDLNNILNRIVDTVKEILKTEISYIELFSEKKDSTPFYICKGIEHLRLDNYIYEKISKGHSILINNLSPSHTEYTNYQLLYSQGIISMNIAPLKSHHKISGLIGAFSKLNYNFTGKELRLLTIFSSEASIIIDNAYLLEKTRELSVTDELTGLYNFRYFQGKLQEEFLRATRYNHELSLFMADIDHFKDFNDTYGHQTGNIVLKNIAKILKDDSRPTDFVCRYGGEEFTIILTETPKENAFRFAERVRKKTEETVFLNEDGKPTQKVTITIGVSNFPTDGPDEYKDLIEYADKSLYRGKESGRNKVVSY
ncbi:MAG: sensor domain-containing diguanylate cyclase [Candidatus Firestonebacteria bacterium]